MVKKEGGKLYKIWHENSLSIIISFLIIVTIILQAFTGWHVFNDELEHTGHEKLSFLTYLGSGHFIEATFENWESEFLQMGLYVVLTIFLRQKGSIESKKLDGKEEVDKEPEPDPNAPWPVRKGGVVKKIYSNSMSIALLLLFLISFLLHAYGGEKVYNIDQVHEGKPTVSMLGYMGSSQFWFESFQNWQSEFVSIISIVVLSIFLRQKGSKESKPVDAPDGKTGD